MQPLLNPLILNGMSKDKKQMTEKILNHALGIIFLLTGEEYVIVKKDSPNSRLQLLTGEVSVKCGDVAVYFSMEEWEYIEGHKKFYKDVVKENEESLEIPSLQSQGHCDENQNLPNNLADQRESPENSFQPVSDTGPAYIHDKPPDTEPNSKEEDSKKIHKTQRVEINSDTGVYKKGNRLGESQNAICTSNERKPLKSSILGDPYRAMCPLDEILCKKGSMLMGSHYAACKTKDRMHMKTNVLEDSHKTFHTSNEIMRIKHNISGDSHKAFCRSTEVKPITGSLQVDSHNAIGAANKIMPMKINHLQGSNKTFCTSEEMMQMRLNSLGDSQNAFCTSGDMMLVNTRLHPQFEKNNFLAVPKSESRPPGKVILTPFSIACQRQYKTFDLPKSFVNRTNEDLSCMKPLVKKSESVGHQAQPMDEKPYICKTERDFSPKQAYTGGRPDTEKKVHKCNVCGKQFPTLSKVSSHSRIHNKPFVCSECGKGFPFRSNLIKHLRTHNKVAQHAYAECGKYFEKRLLEKHYKGHIQEKPYICPECGKCFSQRTSMETHYRTHSKEKPYACRECGKCFAQRGHRNMHQRIHSGEKPFPCPECGKCFTQRIHLDVHYRVHSGEKPYPCPDCGKSFTTRANMDAHQKTHCESNPCET